MSCHLNKSPSHPYWQRKVVWDKHLGRWRRQFFDELTPEQRLAELEYEGEQNRKIAASLGLVANDGEVENGK